MKLVSSAEGNLSECATNDSVTETDATTVLEEAVRLALPEIDPRARYVGIVESFSDEFGFGFIRLAKTGVVTDNVIPLHWRCLQHDPNFPYLMQGMRIEFSMDLCDGSWKKDSLLCAQSLRLLSMPFSLPRATPMSAVGCVRAGTSMIPDIDVEHDITSGLLRINVIWAISGELVASIGVMQEDTVMTLLENVSQFTLMPTQCHQLSDTVSDLQDALTIKQAGLRHGSFVNLTLTSCFSNDQCLKVSLQSLLEPVCSKYFEKLQNLSPFISRDQLLGFSEKYLDAKTLPNSQEIFVATVQNVSITILCWKCAALERHMSQLLLDVLMFNCSQDGLQNLSHARSASEWTASLMNDAPISGLTSNDLELLIPPHVLPYLPELSAIVPMSFRDSEVTVLYDEGDGVDGEGEQSALTCICIGGGEVWLYDMRTSLPLSF